MAASGPITAICAVGSASVQSGSNAGPLIAYNPAPYALRSTTEMRGTCACASAEMDDALAFDGRPDHEARDVREKEQRYIERVATGDETGRLVSRVDKEDA